MISSAETVFLGVVVNPKTFRPVFVHRKADYERTVEVWAADADGRRYVPFGSGYLNSKGDSDYAAATRLTGYPRAHTPSGVRAPGGGYGTCLYTGLVLLAAAHYEGVIACPSLDGKGAGVCSYAGTRSAAADAWWAAADERGLIDHEDGDLEGDEDSEETEEEEGDLEDYISSRGMAKVQAAALETARDYSDDWYVTNVDNIRVTVSRSVQSERGGPFTADIYKLDRAERAGLVALRAEYTGDMMEWARHGAVRGDDKDAEVEMNKQAILAMNVAHEDPLVVGRLALFAQTHGASDAEVIMLIMRNRFGSDVIRDTSGIDFALRQQALDDVRMAPKRTRIAPPTERGRHAPPHPNPAPLPMTRRNPNPAPTGREKTQLERDADALERRRDDLGWDKLQDLP